MWQTTLIRLVFVGVVVVCGLSVRIDASELDVRHEAGWFVAETDRFFVCCTKESDARRLAERCESNTQAIRTRWQVKNAPSAWSPKCQVVLHDTARAYVQEVGQASTAGSSLVDRKQGQITQRRIDLRADHPHGYDDALAHELTHIIAADHFTTRRTPPWADEGMALLGDSQRKRSLHEVDLNRAIRGGRLFNVQQLLTMTEPATPEHWPVFYAQSLSIVEFLVKQGDEPTFFEFLVDADRVGYESALKNHYRFESLGQFETAWLAANR